MLTLGNFPDTHELEEQLYFIIWFQNNVPTRSDYIISKGSSTFTCSYPMSPFSLVSNNLYFFLLQKMLVWVVDVNSIYFVHIERIVNRDCEKH